MPLKENASTQKTSSIARQSNSGGVLVLLLTGSAFFGITAFYFHMPVPVGIEDPWKYRMLTGGKRILSDLAHLQEVVFQQPYPVALRRMVEMFPLANPSEKEGSNIRASSTAIAGVGVRLYEPIERNMRLNGPALIFIHGGGFFFGSADLWDMLVRRIAEELDIVVISIDYRLAPEHVHPAAFDDCFTVTKWVLENASAFGVDRTRVGIGGDSAGGALAAAVAQYIHDDKTLPDLKYQALIYPLSQLLDIETPAQQKYRRDFGENGGMITWWEAAALVSWYLLGRTDDEVIAAFMNNNQTTSQFWRESQHATFVNHALVPEEFTIDENYSPLPVNREGNFKVWSQLRNALLDPRVCPLMRLNMNDLPPAFVATCEFDAMRDNGIYYAKRLAQHGVAVDWRHYEGGFHGVFGPTWPFTFKVGEQMFADFIQFIKIHW